MFEHMQKWLGGLGPANTQEIIQALTKVRRLAPEREKCLNMLHLISRRVSEMGKTNDLALRTQLNLGTEARVMGLLASVMENSKGKHSMVVINTVVCIEVEVTSGVH